jgi:hyperosmotically inducible periplasmic protein
MKKFAAVLLLCVAMVGASFAAQNKNAKPPAKPAAPKAAPAPVDDGAITTAVKDKLAKTPSLKTATINVATNGGVVTLTGSVKTGGLKGVATNVAKSVKGVKKVDNQITVEKKAPAAPKATNKNTKK